MSMTENKAIEVLKNTESNIKIITLDRKPTVCFSSDMVKAFEVAIKALEEVQKYKELGTVEELKALIGKDLNKDCFGNFSLDEVTARIYANANNEDNYINNTFIQYLEDDVLLIIDREDENYFVNLIYNDIECEPSCISNFSPDNRLKANEMISAIRNRIYDYWDLRGNDYQPDFYKTDAFRVETEVNGLNTPSVDFDEKDDR